MNRSMPGLPVHHQLPEFTETHVHRVSDAIQPSHPPSSPSPPAPNPSQHLSLNAQIMMSWRAELCLCCLPLYPSILQFPTCSVQLLSRVWLFAAPWTAARQASLSITNSWSLLKLMSIKGVGDAIQPPYTLLSYPSLLASNLSQHQILFQWVSSLHQVAKILELQL